MAATRSSTSSRAGCVCSSAGGDFVRAVPAASATATIRPPSARNVLRFISCPTLGRAPASSGAANLVRLTLSSAGSLHPGLGSSASLIEWAPPCDSIGIDVPGSPLVKEKEEPTEKHTVVGVDLAKTKFEIAITARGREPQPHEAEDRFAVRFL